MGYCELCSRVLKARVLAFVFKEDGGMDSAKFFLGGYMGRCFLVFGLPRSGTSMVAGILHKLGISMGNDFLEPSEWNPTGFFIDKQILDIHNDLVPHMPELHPIVNEHRLHDLRIWCEEQSKKGDWGFKTTEVPWTLPYLMEWNISPIVIVNCIRPFHTAAKSWASINKIPLKNSIIELGLLSHIISEAISYFNKPVITADYQKIITDPTVEITNLAYLLNKSVNQDAISFVNPELDRFGD